MRCRSLLSLVLALWLFAPLPAGGQADPVPSPESHFGFRPGTDRRLADWTELARYYDSVARASPRVRIDTIGASTRGLPFVLLTITSPENQARLEELRSIHLRLADPRLVTDSAELSHLKAEAKTVVLVTSHIHSTEVGAGQMPANLLYHLATSDSEDVRQILDEVVLLLVPSLNPDGTQLVADWYRQWTGTRFEGREPVELYHEYIGHDNNRDWYALTQVETVLTVEHVHNVWRPMIVHDIHQMGTLGARMFLPPYTDPFERNVDPLIVAAINHLGSYMAAELMTQGMTGVVTGAQFDLFTPARAYQHYHGGVRILSETASAALASPVEIDPDNLRDGRDFRVREPRMNFPAPWTGGRWGMPEIVRYQEAGVMALLRHASRNRAYWVDNFHEIIRRAVEGWPSWPAYWIIPGDQENSTGVDAMLRILTLGSVEVHRAESGFIAEGREFPAGSYVIPMRQPFAAWAQTLLEVQEYPDLREYAGGPPIRPYDVTAHTLPLLMGAEAVAVNSEVEVDLGDPLQPVTAEYGRPPYLEGRVAPRIGLYRGWRESMPAGWTRWLFDQHEIDYVSLTDTDIRSGNLNDRFDVIVFQDQPPMQILRGWLPGQQATPYTGGIGDPGMAALLRFVETGGRLVAIESATDLFIETYGLPVIDRLRGLSDDEFFIPGSILRLDVDTSRISGSDISAESIAWFWRTSRAFDVLDPEVEVIARYGVGDPRLSGWVLGSEHLADRPAVVRIPRGEGSITLFGFQPNYRGHSIATWPLLFRSLIH